MDYEFCVGDVLRIQLNPKNESWRYDYYWNSDKACTELFDEGYGGEYADATVTNIHTNEFTVEVTYQNIKGEWNFLNFPLPGNKAFLAENCQLPGFPQPLRTNSLKKCDCGCEKAKDGGTHYLWCSKIR